MKPHVPKYVWWLLASLASGWIVLPALAYLAGRQVIGPYDGSRGLASYAGSIYAAAGQARPLALSLLFAPAMLFGIWWLHGYLRERVGASESMKPGPKAIRKPP